MVVGTPSGSVGSTAKASAMMAWISSSHRTRARCRGVAPSTPDRPIAQAAPSSPLTANATVWSQPSGALASRLIDWATGS